MAGAAFFAVVFLATGLRTAAFLAVAALRFAGLPAAFFTGAFFFGAAGRVLAAFFAAVLGLPFARDAVVAFAAVFFVEGFFLVAMIGAVVWGGGER